VKVYVVVYYDYEDGGYEFIFATRELAETWLREHHKDNDRYAIEESEVLNHQPEEVMCYFAQRDGNNKIHTGKRKFYEGSLPIGRDVGKWLAWSTVSEADARRLLAVKEGRAGCKPGRRT
jgi:hypothetical protein